MGISFGTLVGIVTDNIGLWLSVGLAIGAGVGNSLAQKEKAQKEKEDKS